MSYRKIFHGLGLNHSYFELQSKSVNLVFREDHHDGDADQYRTHIIPILMGATEKERRQLGGRSVEYRTLLSTPFRSLRLTRTITPTRAWAKERLSSYFPDPSYCPNNPNISHPEAVRNAQEGVLSDFRVPYLGAQIVTDKSRAAKKQLIRDFEGMDGSASVDCQGLSSLPLLSPQESWELRNCDTLRVRSPNFLASPDTKSVTLHGCPPAFESLEFLDQLPELIHLDVSMSSAESPCPPIPLLYDRGEGARPRKNKCFCARSNKLTMIKLANFERIPIFGQDCKNIRELVIRGCKEQIEARHLPGFEDRDEWRTTIDLRGNLIRSLPDGFFKPNCRRPLTIIFNPSKTNPEVIAKIKEAATKPIKYDEKHTRFIPCADVEAR
jgi:hypothetical protein